MCDWPRQENTAKGPLDGAGEVTMPVWPETPAPSLPPEKPAALSGQPVWRWPPGRRQEARVASAHWGQPLVTVGKTGEASVLHSKALDFSSSVRNLGS